MTRAGLPTTTACAGTSETTTAPAPTTEFLPSVTLGRTTAPAPTYAPGRTRTRPPRTQLGPRDTNSSRTTSWPTETPRLIETNGPTWALEPIIAPALTTVPSPNATVLATMAVGSTMAGK